jgi:glutamate formiminotransferase
MNTVIIKIVEIDGAKSVKFEGDDATAIKESERVRVEVVPVGPQHNRAIITVICEA